MSKSKHSAEWKIALVKKYLSGEGSHAVLAKSHGVSKRSLQDWVRRYREQGEAGFSCGVGRRGHQCPRNTMIPHSYGGVMTHPGTSERGNAG